MPLLGRGTPALSATVAISRDYFSRDGGVALHQMSERPDLRIFNVTFDKCAYPSEPVYASTHGIFKAQGDGERTHLGTPAENVESIRPTTALASAGLCLTHSMFKHIGDTFS